ncbi:MAG: rod shape-determining protein [Cloacibacillus evryensis]
MVVDIGGGTTDIAIVSLGGLVVFESLRVGGDKFDEAIVRCAKQVTWLSATDGGRRETGRRLRSDEGVSRQDNGHSRTRPCPGLPRQVTVNSVDVAKAIDEPVSSIIAGIKRVLEKTPLELSADVMDRG